MGRSPVFFEIDTFVERRIGDLGEEIPRFLVQLRMWYHRRREETACGRKGHMLEGNNPNWS